ncbi:FlxA-like family protein [Aurantivibrio infirmus]
MKLSLVRSIGAIAGAMWLMSGSVSAQQAPSQEEMWEILQQQKAEIEGLKERLDEANEKISDNDEKVSITADAVENISSNAFAGASGNSSTTLGGYAELHYNKLDNDLSGGEDKDEIDFHRFVLFLGHEFSDSVRMFSELEVEHSIAGEGQNGEIELEQAYIEWDINKDLSAKAGLFLIPVGILNETHEPNTFYGVERNSVEKNIIPTTWWEAGGAVSGEIAPGLSFDFALHSGLFMENGSVRSGRQKVSEAKADDFAATGRIRYTGIAGLELSATLQQQTDVLQGENIGGASDVSALLAEVHAIYETGPFSIRALYAMWDIDDDIEMLTVGADKQKGWYVEPSFDVNDKIGLFVRVSQWDTQAGASNDSEYDQIDFGINYMLTEGVVLKADYQRQKAPTGSNEFDGFNFGIGWAF